MSVPIRRGRAGQLEDSFHAIVCDIFDQDEIYLALTSRRHKNVARSDRRRHDERNRRLGIIPPILQVQGGTNQAWPHDANGQVMILFSQQVLQNVLGEKVTIIAVVGVKILQEFGLRGRDAQQGHIIHLLCSHGVVYKRRVQYGNYTDVTGVPPILSVVKLPHLFYLTVVCLSTNKRLPNAVRCGFESNFVFRGVYTSKKTADLTHGTGILVDQGSDNEDKIRYLVLLDIQ
jgi:hypothetical protein